MTAAERLAEWKAICDVAPQKIEPYVTAKGGVVVFNGPFPMVQAQACSDFIAAARTAMPRLIEALEYLMETASDEVVDLKKIDAILSGGMHERR